MNRTAPRTSPPPLIRAKRVPFWILFRDILLTAVAWLAIAQSMREGIRLLYDYFSPPMFALTSTRAPQWLDFWDPLRAFVLIAACFVIWLAFWSLHGARHLRVKPTIAQPRSLSCAEHARTFGVTEDQLERWRSYRIAVVAFSADRQIARVSSHDLEPTLAAARVAKAVS